MFFIFLVAVLACNVLSAGCQAAAHSSTRHALFQPTSLDDTPALGSNAHQAKIERTIDLTLQGKKICSISEEALRYSDVLRAAFEDDKELTELGFGEGLANVAPSVHAHVIKATIALLNLFQQVAQKNAVLSKDDIVSILRSHDLEGDADGLIGLYNFTFWLGINLNSLKQESGSAYRTGDNDTQIQQSFNAINQLQRVILDALPVALATLTAEQGFSALLQRLNQIGVPGSPSLPDASVLLVARKSGKYRHPVPSEHKRTEDSKMQYQDELISGYLVRNIIGSSDLYYVRDVDDHSRVHRGAIFPELHSWNDAGTMLARPVGCRAQGGGGRWGGFCCEFITKEAGISQKWNYSKGCYSNLEITACAFGPHNLLALGDVQGKVTLWQRQQGIWHETAIYRPKIVARVSALAWSKDGKLAVGYQGRTCIGIVKVQVKEDKILLNPLVVYESPYSKKENSAQYTTISLAWNPPTTTEKGFRHEPALLAAVMRQTDTKLNKRIARFVVQLVNNGSRYSLMECGSKEMHDFDSESAHEKQHAPMWRGSDKVVFMSEIDVFHFIVQWNLQNNNGKFVVDQQLKDSTYVSQPSRICSVNETTGLMVYLKEQKNLWLKNKENIVACGKRQDIAEAIQKVVVCDNGICGVEARDQTDCKTFLLMPSHKLYQDIQHGTVSFDDSVKEWHVANLNTLFTSSEKIGLFYDVVTRNEIDGPGS